MLLIDINYVSELELKMKIVKQYSICNIIMAFECETNVDQVVLRWINSEFFLYFKKNVK